VSIRESSTVSASFAVYRRWPDTLRPFQGFVTDQKLREVFHRRADTRSAPAASIAVL
jgi:hypothetical protein